MKEPKSKEVNIPLAWFEGLIKCADDLEIANNNRCQGEGGEVNFNSSRSRLAGYISSAKHILENHDN